MINPDGVRNQVEGNVIQGVSRALLEEVLFDANGVTSLDWATYPILRFPDVPELEVVLINRPEMQALGAGEGATIPPAAAIANATALASRRAIVGDDPLPNGFASNRKALEAIIRFAHEQKILPRLVEPKEIFAAESRAS